MKRLSLVLAMVLFAVGSVLAQRTITGKVTDTNGEALIGASVLVKGTSKGTITDVDGLYSLDVEQSGTVTLAFSYTGFTTKEVVTGASTVIDITLDEASTDLSEVVVTGLGIQREKKALGFGVTTLAAKDIQARPESDVARLLRGKATGVDITQTSGMAGTGTNVIIRGYKSITGTNQPLFVIDGVPFNSDSNQDQGFVNGGATASNRFLDLDPNSIAEISILKGLSATVLYGEAGRNGVILVTTKNGRAGENLDKKMEVSVTQSVFQSEVANLPDYQNTYGNGFGGDFGWFFSNWGAPFAARGTNGVSKEGTIVHPYDQAQFNDDFPEYAGVPYAYQPYPSVENFFEPGLTSNTSISLENRLGANSAISATYSYLNDEGFTPDLDAQRGGGASNFLKKHNFGLGASTKLGNGINLKGTFNYVYSDQLTPITSAASGGDSDGEGGLFAALLFTPRSIDLMNLPYQSPIDGSNVYYRRGGQIQNPRWTLNNAGDKGQVQRFFGTMEASYEIRPWLKALYRLGLDQYTQRNQRFINKGGQSVPDGLLQTTDRLNRITDQLFNLLYDFRLSEDFTLDGVLGVNLRREAQNFQGTRSTQQFVYNLFTHDNYINHRSNTYNSTENTLGVFSTLSLGYRSFAYLNLQARNDWTSTLEKANRSIFYPSASFSFIPTEAFPSLMSGNIVNFLKIRLGYGTSAGYPDPYQTRNVLGTATRSYVSSGGTVLNTNFVSDRLGNPNLKPELHTEVEAGVEARFLNARVGVDLSLYDRTSSDLIIDLDLDPATGFSNTTVNAAKIQNKGVELGLDFNPVRGNFNWDFTLNYTKNISEVLSIAEGVSQIPIAGYLNPGNYAVVGQPYGIMQGSKFERYQDGQLLVNGQGSYTATSAIGIIGDPNPDYTANWINTFSYKGLSFGFQFQYIKGGSMYSSTVQSLLARGNTTDTDVDRYIPIVLPGVKADGTPNDIQTYMGDVFFDAYFGASEGGVFDATSIRLRDLSLSYALPKKLLDKTPFGSVSLSIRGENLWYNAPNFPKGINFDPEVNSLGVGNGRGFDWRTAPTAKKYGFSLNVTF